MVEDWIETIRPDGWLGLSWLPIVSITAVILTGVLAWSWTRRRTSSAVTGVAVAAKLTAIALLLASLLEPIRRDDVPTPKDNVVPVLVDRSFSTTIASGGRTPASTIASLIDAEQPWLASLAETYDVKLLAYGDRVRSIDRAADAAPSDRRSDLTLALEEVAERYGERAVAGVVVLTDGRTDSEIATSQASEPVPIFPVLAGQGATEPDIRVTRVASRQTNFEAAPVAVTAEIAWSDATSGLISVQLISELGEVVATQIVDADQRPPRAIVEFETDTQPGDVHFYDVVAVAGQAPSNEALTAERLAEMAESELTALNNSRSLVVNRSGGPFRILYVTGRPNWEFKFLRRALEEDEELRLTGLIRIAKRKPKFSFREAGTDANPLFRGFDANQEEVAEQYDEPVMLRVGVESPDELRSGFPKTAEELFGYDALIVDDLEAQFFTQDQKQLVHDFVAERGGGLLMLGGAESFQSGGYARTRIGDVLPVYVDAISREPSTELAELRLSRDGLLEPWLRLRPTESAERLRLREMARFRTIHQLPGIKPGATVLAEFDRGDEQRFPAIVTHRFGKGQAAAFAVGDYWRQHMRRRDSESDDFGKAWRQSVRWLVSDVPRRVSIDPGEVDRETGVAEFTIHLLDEEYRPLNNAEVTAQALGEDGQIVEIPVRPIDEQAGAYQMTASVLSASSDVLVSQKTVISVTATDYEGEPCGEAAVGVTARPFDDELGNLAPRDDVYASIAEQTGGKLLRPSDLTSLVSLLSEQPHVLKESRIRPLWHRWSVLLAVALLLALEWGLRRWKGMP